MRATTVWQIYHTSRQTIMVCKSLYETCCFLYVRFTHLPRRRRRKFCLGSFSTGALHGQPSARCADKLTPDENIHRSFWQSRDLAAAVTSWPGWGLGLCHGWRWPSSGPRSCSVESSPRSCTVAMSYPNGNSRAGIASDSTQITPENGIKNPITTLYTSTQHIQRYDQIYGVFFINRWFKLTSRLKVNMECTK